VSKSKKKSRATPAAVAAEPFFADRAKEDIAWWRKTDPKIVTRIDALIADIRRSPFAGIGKPEPLRHEWQGYWSRRITGEHRLVYRIEAGRLYILQARYHY
jgi:toxin YoeB